MRVNSMLVAVVSLLACVVCSPSTQRRGSEAANARSPAAVTTRASATHADWPTHNRCLEFVNVQYPDCGEPE